MLHTLTTTYIGMRTVSIVAFWKPSGPGRIEPRRVEAKFKQRHCRPGSFLVDFVGLFGGLPLGLAKLHFGLRLVAGYARAAQRGLDAALGLVVAVGFVRWLTTHPLLPIRYQACRIRSVQPPRLRGASRAV